MEIRCPCGTLIIDPVSNVCPVCGYDQIMFEKKFALLDPSEVCSIVSGS